MKYRLGNFNFFLNNCVNLPEYLFLTVFGEFQDGEKPFATVEGRKTHGAKITMYSVFSISISKFLILIIYDGITNEKKCKINYIFQISYKNSLIAVHFEYFQFY